MKSDLARLAEDRVAVREPDPVPSPAQAAVRPTCWQKQSCAYGIDGSLLWTWDTNEQHDLWNAMSDGGVIDQALSPKTRPDPCG